MVNAKKKGNAWEHKVAKFLSSHGFKTWKDSASGGGSREKGDIGNSLDMTIESKSTKVIRLPEWWKQVSHSASLQRNQPVLFIHQDGMGNEEWLVVMHSNDWVEMLKKSKTEKIYQEVPQEDSNSKKWAIQNAITSLKKLLKEYE